MMGFVMDLLPSATKLRRLCFYTYLSLCRQGGCLVLEGGLLPGRCLVGGCLVRGVVVSAPWGGSARGGPGPRRICSRGAPAWGRSAPAGRGVAVVDPGFSRGGDANSPGGRQHTILPNFPKNCMKLKEFGLQGANVPRAPALDLPLGCIPTCTEADPSPGRDGYCCGRYASYWNAFFLKITLLAMITNSAV